MDRQTKPNNLQLVEVRCAQCLQPTDTICMVRRDGKLVALCPKCAVQGGRRSTVGPTEFKGAGVA